MKKRENIEIVKTVSVAIVLSTAIISSYCYLRNTEFKFNNGVIDISITPKRKKCN